ncbi:MAG: acetyl-CoA C-acyltransferase [Nannocystis sp.]|uniref:acetyl-CoA C-acyltransferase n=1 Tax=Nannocystis sp. TaxID=1962667 RepID=UPI00242136C1|nr:acetyl-CoA C-acyltransferase [Nannocystis sp.]MBK9756637.1 acetyl-CoA C-acyltransferase [Nannocystis sp.]
MSTLQDAVLVAARRSAVGRALKGTLRNTRPDDFAAQVVRAALADLPGLPLELIDDLVLGCAMPEAEQGLNVARVVGLRAGLPDSSAAITINRFCASGLQAIASVAERIRVGAIEAGIAGGLESMSMVPMGGNKAVLNPAIVAERPELYISMGLTAENVARKFEVSRADQDAFALASHIKAVAAIAAGRFAGEIAAVTTAEGTSFAVDEAPRADTTLDALAQLRPVFHAMGSVTAGNSSPINDGAAAAVLVSASRAEALGLRPLARFVGFAVAGVAPELMGIGPIAAIPKVLAQTGLTLADIDLIELNEAFASQSLACIRKLGLDPEKVNVNGGAIALGHPLGCTGAKLTATLIAELHRRGARYGMVSMCIGGGMGAAGIFERM